MSTTIKNRWTDRAIYTVKDATLRDAVIEAVKSGAYLGGANLSGAYLGGANLSGANLSGANLGGANLICADLGDADLGCADLGCADLRGAYLLGAYLCGANLGGADLRGAYLGEGKIISTASVQFTGHGECGRQLLAVKTESEIRLWCGCFMGSPDELRAFIENGNVSLKRTRTVALETVMMLLDVTNDSRIKERL